MGSEAPIWVRHENGAMRPDHLCDHENATRWVKLEDHESSLAASQERVRELEREKETAEWHRGPRNEDMLAFVRRAETAEQRVEELEREKRALGEQLSASGRMTMRMTRSFSEAQARAETAERERDEAVARAEEAEEKARRLSARLDKVDPARAYKLVGTAAERVSPPALGVYPPSTYYKQCGGQTLPNGSVCSQCGAYTGSSGICTRMIEVSTRPDPGRSDAGGEERK